MELKESSAPPGLVREEVTPWMPPRLTRTPSFDAAAAASERAQKVECVASHFVVCGLSTSGLLDPLGLMSDEVVIDDARIVLPGRGEECPAGYTFVTEQPSGHRASLNQGNVLGSEVLLAVRFASRHDADRPLTGLAIIYAEEQPPSGFQRLETSVGGEPASLNGRAGRDIYLCVSRETQSAEARGDEITPLKAVTVLRRTKQSRELAVPPGYQLIERNTNSGSLSGQPVAAAPNRARVAALCAPTRCWLTLRQRSGRPTANETVDPPPAKRSNPAVCLIRSSSPSRARSRAA